MKTAYFTYKCRLCGEIYKPSATGDKNALPFLMNAVYGTKFDKDLIGGDVYLIDIHATCKKGCGVSDLIGYVLED